MYAGVCKVWKYGSMCSRVRYREGKILFSSGSSRQTNGGRRLEHRHLHLRNRVKGPTGRGRAGQRRPRACPFLDPLGASSATCPLLSPRSRLPRFFSSSPRQRFPRLDVLTTACGNEITRFKPPKRGVRVRCVFAVWAVEMLTIGRLAQNRGIPVRSSSFNWHFLPDLKTRALCVVRCGAV